MLNVSADCLLYCHPMFRPFLNTQFLSKLCKDAFAGYAVSQIKKARGLNKKINYPQPPERKTPLDFCFVAERQGSIPVNKWLEIQGFVQERCGLVHISNMRDLYGLFYDPTGVLGYSGILQKENANDVALSSVPKGESYLVLMAFNKDAYSQHCRDYRSYQEWLENRNEERYNNTMQHGKNYDAKNMMHTFRLLDMAAEMLEHGEIIVRRPNREELLAIRRGEFTFEELIERAEARIDKIELLYESSSLPDIPDKNLVETLLVAVRNGFYCNVF